jgi:SAM-dependent methyltransferase
MGRFPGGNRAHRYRKEIVCQAPRAEFYNQRRCRRSSVKQFACALFTVVLWHTAAGAGQQPPSRLPDAPFVPTPDAVVEGMLAMAGVTSRDVVYDLGSGDGKIVIAAARHGARGVGIDIDPARIAEANENARRAGVTDRVTFILGDIFDPTIRIGDATVVALYLWERLNVRLIPRFKSELRPGTRIVSNSFTLGPTWPPEKSQLVGIHYVYLWTIR